MEFVFYFKNGLINKMLLFGVGKLSDQSVFELLGTIDSKTNLFDSVLGVEKVLHRPEPGTFRQRTIYGKFTKLDLLLPSFLAVRPPFLSSNGIRGEQHKLSWQLSGASQSK